MIRAPTPMDRTAASLSKVWSEYPIVVDLNWAESFVILPKLASLDVTGYAETQCKSARLAPDFLFALLFSIKDVKI